MYVYMSNYAACCAALNGLVRGGICWLVTCAVTWSRTYYPDRPVLWQPDRPALSMVSCWRSCAHAAATATRLSSCSACWKHTYTHTRTHTEQNRREEHNWYRVQESSSIRAARSRLKGEGGSSVNCNFNFSNFQFSIFNFQFPIYNF